MPRPFRLGLLRGAQFLGANLRGAFKSEHGGKSTYRDSTFVHRAREGVELLANGLHLGRVSLLI
jgi:hypothetical protein